VVATAIATGTFPRDEDDVIRSKLQTVCRGLTERVGASWPLS